ncbi:MAG: putative Ig domain-containing protein [Verrucomicrobiaceae bacterium]|nr:putative Ig domain-containing protein [Verrucomicrobiaceae bacterium]
MALIPVPAGSPAHPPPPARDLHLHATDYNGCAGSSAYNITTAANTDFGDWSHATNPTGAATTTTTSVSNSNLRLGEFVDAEASVAPNSAATTDDTTGGTDDEDGVTVPASITQNASATVTARVLNTSGANGFLHAWIDFNNDGVFNNTIYTTAGGERLEAVRTITTGTGTTTAQNITFTVPSNASPGAQRGVRVRFTNQNATTPTGASGTGEVEDYVVTIACKAITVNPTSLANGTVGIGYSQTVSATGGTAPYTYALTSGTLPAGLSFNTSSGAITGTPTTSNGAGTSLTFTATDSLGCTGVRTVTLKVCPVISLSDLGGSAVVGRAFSQTVTASGGATAYTFAHSTGTLPAGLSLAASTGIISGTPTTAGTSSFTITATDANGCATTKGYTIQTHATLLEWNTEDSTSGGRVSLPSFVHGCIFNTNGLNHSDNGTILSTSNSVLNGIAMTGARARSTTGWDNLDTLTLPRPNDSFNDRVLTSTFAFENLLSLTWGNFSMDVRRPATNSPIKYRAALVWFQGSYPYSSGVTPPASAVKTAWTNTFTVTSTNTWTTMNLPFTNFSSGITALPAYNEVANEKLVLIVQAWDSGGAASPGALEYDNIVLGGSATCGPALSIGDTVFADLNGTNTYEPATDSGINGLAVELLTAAGTSFAPAVTTTTNASGVYTFTGLPAGGYKVKVTPNASYGLAVTAVNADNGVNNDSNGIQSAVGQSAISPVITLANNTEPGTAGGGNAETTIDFGFKTCPTITVNATPLANGVVGTAYSQGVTGTGGVGPYSFSVISGTLPAGLSLNTSSGVVSGTPTSSTSQTFTIQIRDAYGCVGSRPFTVTPACPSITVNPTSLANGIVGLAYSQTVSAVGGTAPHTFAVSAGTLPAGLSLNASTGAITGTPTTSNGAGVSITIRATDTYGCQGTRPYTLKICPVITVNPVSLANGTVGTAYSQTASATGGATPYVFAVSSGTLPAGLSLNTSTGAITGTPTSAGSSTFTLRATDVNGCVGSRPYTVLMSCPAITVNPVTVPVGLVGTAYTSTTFTATGGTAPFTYTVTSGTLPAGLSLTTAGVLSGTPTTANGTGVSITVQARDANNCTGVRVYTVKICPVITLPAISTTLTVGTAYSASVVPTGGTSPFVYSVSSGTLPAGLSLNTSTGAITGTPTSTTSRTFTITATDASVCTGSRAYTLTPVCPTITISPASLPNALIGTAYSQTLTATGGTASYTWSVSSGTLPAGLTLTTAGVLSGTPTAANGAGVSITFRAQDAYGCASTRVITVRVCPAITTSPTSLANGTVGTAYSQTFAASGGAVAYTYAVVSGTLPAGLSLNASTGVISGTPTSSTAQTFTLSATDANTCVATRPYTVTPVCPAITVNPTSLPAPTIGVAYSQTVSATGGTSPYTFAVSSGTLPAGLSLNTGTGAITGTATSTTATSFTIRATDLYGCQGVRSYNIVPPCPAPTITNGSLMYSTTGTAYTQATGFSLSTNAALNAAGYNLSLAVTPSPAPGTITMDANGRLLISATVPVNVYKVTPQWATRAPYTSCVYSADRNFRVCPIITVNPATLSAMTVGTPHSTTITATGGTAPYSFAVTSGTLPAGLSLTSAGVLSGTPTSTPSQSFSITATDANGCPGSRPYTVAPACPAITVNPTSLANGTIGTAYSQTVSATGGTAPYTFAVSVGTLPAGLSLNTSTGAITGTPTSTTAQSFTIRATDNYGCQGTRPYTVTPVCPAITINPVLVPSATVGVAYSQTISATGGTAPYSYAVSVGTLPAGLTLSTAGVLSGTPTTSNGAGVSVTIRATDNYGCQNTRVYTIKVCPVVTLGAITTTGTVGAAYSQTVTASGGATPYTFAVTSGSLPGGLSLNTTTGVISGTPNVEISSTVTIRATDANGCPGTRSYTLAMSCPPITVNPGSVPVGLAGTAYPSTTFSATGGTAPYQYTVVAGSLPAGLTLTTAGVLSGTPTTANGAGVSITVQARDAYNCLGTRAYTIKICPVITLTAPPLATATVTQAYSQTIVASGGTTPYTFAIASGALPAGLSLNTATGVISGTPTALTAASFTLSATDANGCPGSRAYTITPVCPAITVSPTSLPNGTVGTAYSQTISATGGTGTKTFAVTTGTLPAGLTLTSGGLLSGTPTSITSQTFTITATDTLGCTGARSFTITPNPNTDWGDHSGFATVSNTLNSNLRIGALTDVEGVAPTNATATGDDTSGSDDEDGVTFPSMTAGQSVTVPVTVTNATGAAANLNVWVDFNDNGVLTDAGEQVANNVSIPTGSTNLVRNVSFTLPPSTVTSSSIGVRVRLTTAASPGPTGSGTAGEIEDYAVNVLNPTTDFGDWSGAADAINTTNSNLRLGALVDAEYVATKNATATGDDTTGNDDEDGVTIPTLTAGAPATVAVTLTNNTGAAAYLNAWIDFNNNGSFADSGEQVFANITITNGTTNVLQNLGVTVPVNAVTGVNLGARFRLTSVVSPGPTGIGTVGEVEDYVVSIAQPTTDFGDYASFPSASSTRNSNLRLGAAIDTEYTPTTNSSATGDDTTATDDEDGVTIPTLTAGAPATIPVVITNNTGAAVNLNAWIDFNGNNSVADAGEQIATNVSYATGLTNSTQNLNITVPASAITGVSLGVRFRLTSTASPGFSGASGNGEVEDYTTIISAPTTDFGDFVGFADASQGANTSLRMGASIDTEFVATKNAAATGDDTTGTDDEDGVTIPAVTAGQTVTVPVTVTNATGANAFLNAWADFNNNNTLGEAGEQFATNVSIPAGTANGTVNLTFAVPANAVTGVNLGVRFRLAAPTGLGPTGLNALTGEVEDYVVNVLAPTTDFGDHGAFADASSVVVAAIRLGATTDKEYASTKNASATGDDITGSDDEDGVTMPSFTAGAPATIPVVVTNTSGLAVNLNAWIDFNNNGSFADAGEQVATNTSVATGLTNSTLNLNVTVPAAAVTGLPLGARFRLTSTASPGATGASGNGEVEDYTVTISAPTTDFGDWNRVADASNGTSTNLRLGATVDTEFASTRNATATGDDTTGSDDEDGVTFPSLIAGGSFTVPVTVTNATGTAAFLNAWIDFNNNGVLTDAGEQIATNTNVATGLSNSTLNLTVNVPVGAVTGTALGSRFRITSATTPGATGSSGGTGEVEDYTVTISQPTTDFGDHSALASASSTVSSALKLGPLTDVEYIATTNGTATGDDTTGSDDEDAVTMPSLTAGAPATIPVLATNTSGSPAYLNAWIDYNGNGLLTDAGEQVATNVAVATGTNNIAQNLSITVPATATQGAALPVRVRLTNIQNPGATGLSGTGEVEDYTVTVATPPSDFGDFSGFGSAFSTRNAAIKIGATTDTEFAATLNALGSGDDTTGSDDEDGVTVPSMTAGAPATLVVNVTNTSGAAANLNAWIDFNNNGILTDAGEQIATNTSIATGTNAVPQNIAFTVPAAAVTGTNIGIRVRLTSTATPGSTGGSGNGEVEDHIVNIAVPTTDFGDWNGAADASSTQSNNLRMGPLVDTEYVSTRNGTATGDDITASDDEDGVTLPTLTPGTSSNASVTVTNLSGAAAFLNAWIDFNNNGSFADAGEQVATNVSIATGTNGTAQSVSIATPLAAVPGQRGARFRFTSTTNPGATGASGIGEVEDYLVTVNCLPVTVNPTSVAAGLVGSAYSQTLTGGGGMAPYSFAVTAGTLPAGLTLSTAGVISGTPTTSNGAGVNVTITATDAYGCTGSRAYTIKICPVISLAALNSTLTIGSAYSSSAAASGGTAPYVYALTSGTLPAGLSLNTSTGAVTGTPTSGTSQTFTIRATDANACTGTRSYTLAPACPTITVTPTTPPNAFLNTAYSQTFSATGGTAAYTYAVTSGTLPAGLTLSTAGVLSGTPTTAGTSVVTIRATDNYGCTGSASVTITVRGLIIGDMIFNDANNNGLLDGGETGISGATVQLWNPGADNVIGGASADTQVGSNFTTTATGLYSFTNLPPGNYYVRVTLPAPFNMTGGTPATTDNNVNNNNDGSQPGGVGTPLFSPVINLATAAESTTDGDADSSSNLTIDFGAYAGICVGNLVFKDVNNNGSYQAGTDTVLSGVQLRIFPSSVTDPLTGTPLYSTTSNASGIYQFCVPAGSYYIHVPPSQFATSAVLDNHIPAIGPTDNVVTPIDDNLDQNVLMAFKPSFTGVNTGIFTLVLGTEPTNATGETGTANTSDDTADSNTDLTVDLGFYPLPPPGTPLSGNTFINNLSASNSMTTNVLAAPITYAQWQLDHDGTLLDYALASPFRLEATDAVLTRPVPSRSDLVYRLEASTDMQSWAPLAITPSTTFNADNTETTRFAKLDLAPLFVGCDTGFIRLKVELDADLNGTAEQVTHSRVQAWSLRTFAAAPQTFSMPLLRPAIFEGKASEAQNLALNASVAYFAEIVEQGTRFEIDSTSGSLTWKTSAPAADDHIIIRPHWTLATLFPPAAFRAAINPANADRIMFFDGKGYRIFWLKASALGAHWARQDDTTLADAGSTILAPGEGVLVHSRSTEITLPVSGEVRAWNFIISLRAGSQLIGSGHPLDQSPASMSMTSSSGFSPDADKLQLWNGDSTMTRHSFRRTHAGTAWFDTNNIESTHQKLLPAFHAIFLTTDQSIPSWIMKPQ